MLEKYFESKEAYVELGFQDTKGQIKKIKAVNNSDIKPFSEKPFILHPSMKYSGSEEEGYTLTGTEIGKRKQVSGFTKPINILTESIYFKADVTVQDWAHLGLSSAYTTGTMFTDKTQESKYNAIGLMINNYGQNRLKLSVYIDNEDPKLIKGQNVVGYVYNFNWDKAHAYGFALDENGKWCFLVDGKPLDELSSSVDAVIDYITPFLNNLKDSGVAYAQFGFYAATPSFSQIKIMKSEDAKILSENLDDDFGDWDDTWTLVEGENANDDEWEFNFGEAEEKPVNKDKQNIEKGLSSTVIIIIVVGSILLSGGIVATIIIFIKRKKKSQAK